MASSSSSPSSMLKYDVFLSFRGEDTRKTFVDHLYSALVHKEIATFRDSENLERGKSIGQELVNAIGDSSIAIIVFSNNFASSSWCLDEVVEIMRHRKERKLVVYPVFYGVEPSDVRKQKGTFGLGFQKHRSEKVKSWKEALEEVANLSGWNTKEISNGHEAECIKIIVKDVQNTLPAKYTIPKEKLIGIIPRVEKVKSLLRTKLDDVSMIGIWGMGGAGKTTIAECVFAELKNQFHIHKFVKNVRETTERSGIHSVQKELLSSVDKNMEIENVIHGTHMIKKVFSRQKVLIVLDDVNQISQLDALAGDHKWFAEGSRIIITTRDERLLRAHNVIDIYNVDLLDNNEAFQLLSLHAFGINVPVNDYEKHLHLVVRYAGGHPLTLKVLGNYLRGRDMNVWIKTRDRLKEISKTETLEILKVSFDALEDIEKEVFLDIACFFKGWRSTEVCKILDCCEFETEKWVSDLIQKSLVYISNERLDMHDMIQEMGQHIVCGKNPNKPQKHSRLWRRQDFLDIIVENKGTEKIEAIVVEGLSTFEVINFSNSFKNMTNLRLLHLDTIGLQIIGPEYLPNSLQYLNWTNYTSNSFPSNFGARKLVGLYLHSSSIVQLWEGVKHLRNLKYVDCKGSKNLIKTPNFTGVPNLEILDLSGCSSLLTVHESIGNLENLKNLDLSNCYELKSFPSYIQMKSLEVLDLCHCHNFNKFPEIQGKMERLTHMYLEHTIIQELPSSIVNLTNLSFFSLLGCINLSSLPHSFCTLQRLTYLDVRRCIKLSTLPQELGNISCLEHLLMSNVTRLPSSISRLKNLKTFSVVEPPPPSSSSSSSLISQKTRFLDCFYSKQANTKHINSPQDSLHHILPSLSSLTSLTELGLCNLHEGTILPVDIGTLSSLKYLILCNNQFSKPPFTISQLSVLKRLDLSNCQNIESLPELPPNVAVVFANNCKSLKTITGLSSSRGLLRQVSFLGCWGLEHPLTDTTATMLQTALQGYDGMNQQTSILLPGSQIPKWFHNATTGIGQTVIKLPENWHDVITGISLCVVADFMGLTRPISLTLSTEPIPSVNSSGSYHSDRLHMWMEYVSFDLLQRSCMGIIRPDWITTTLGLILTISTESSGVKICGARLIYKNINMENEKSEGVLMRQTKLLKCFRESEYDGVTYSLQPGIKYIPEGDVWFDKLSWNKKHEYYRSGRSSIKIGMNILD